MVILPYLILGMLVLGGMLFGISRAFSLNKTRYWPGVLVWIVSFILLLAVCILQSEQYRTQDPWNYGSPLTSYISFPGLTPNNWFLNALIFSALFAVLINFIYNKIRGR